MKSRRSLKEAINSDTELSSFVFGEALAQNSSSSESVQKVPLASVHRTSFQKRRYFDQQKIEEWANSEIKVNGIRSPLWIRPLPEGEPGAYELIAGERRFRAAKYLGFTEIPAIIFDLDDKQALMASLIENMQRQDLNPLEETEGTLAALAMELNHSVDQVISLLYQMNNAAKGTVNQNVLVSSESQKVEMVFKYLGRVSWKSFVSSRLPLLKKPKEIIEALRNGQIEYTKAMEVAKVRDENHRQQILDLAIAQQLSLNEIKEKIKQLKQESKPSAESTEPSLSRQVDEALRQFKKSKVWDNPKKKRQVEKLLAQLKALMED
jgi:ParB family chromosome partitioning protein